MVDPESKVSPGAPLAVRASTWNSLVDASRRSKGRIHDVGRAAGPPAETSGTILVKNTASLAVPRFGILALGKPVFGPGANLDEFKNNVCLEGSEPDEDTTSFAIMREPVAAGAIGRGLVVGVTVCRLFVPTGTGDDPVGGAAPDDATRLKASRSGSATVIWREGGEAEQWAFVSLGAARTGVFPVVLEKTGGADGSQSADASWRYTVKDEAGVELDADVDPAAAPHRWVRPSLGRMLPATFGYAHVNSAGDLVVGWCNEALLAEACA